MPNWLSGLRDLIAEASPLPEGPEAMDDLYATPITEE